MKQSITKKVAGWHIGLWIFLACCLPTAWAGAPLPPASFTIPQGAYSAQFIEDRNHISLIQFSGNYDRQLDGGQLNAAARAVVAKEFYKTHPDNYDFLVIFSSFEFNTGEATAFYIGTKNDTQGIGLPLFDNTPLFGSAGHLQGYIDMGAMSRYDFNPLSEGYETVQGVLAHELLHRWAAHVKFRDPQTGAASEALLGRDKAHWSFFLDTGASVEYGARWRDNGNGTFSSEAVRRFYSPLDLYLMGLNSPEEVPPFFLIQPLASEYIPEDLPLKGVTVSGVRKNVTIQDIIANEGPRIPAKTSGQKEFRMAFIYLTGAGETATPEKLADINNVRRSFMERFSIMTGGRGLAQVYPEGLSPTELGAPEPVTSADGTLMNGVNVPAGLAWLRSQQDTDGSWKDKSATQLRDTAEAATTLRELDTNFTRLADAILWLQEQSPKNNNDSMARSLDVLPIDDANKIRLLARQKTDGGFSLSDSLQSNPLDTALAVQSLARYSAVPANALAYLASHQNADHGWPDVVGGKSTVRATALVLQALKKAASSKGDVPGAVAWLASQQRANGGFAEAQDTGAGSVHDAALALLALKAADATSAIDSGKGIQFIADRQLQSGSWSGSVYTTALALRALQGISLPNLAVSSFTMQDAAIQDGQRATLQVTITNDSPLPADPVLLRVYNGDPAQAGASIVGQTIVPRLVGGSSRTFDISWDTYGQAGPRQLFAVVDADNVLVERTDKDNSAVLPVTVAAAPQGVELETVDQEFLIDPAHPDTLPQQLALMAVVRNVGMADAANVTVKLRAGDAVTGAVLATQTLPKIVGRASVPVNFTADLTQGGTTTYYVIVDPEQQQNESNRSNNIAKHSVTADATVDYEVRDSDITVSPANPVLQQDATFNITIRNKGTIPTPAVPVRFSMVNANGVQELQTIQVVLSPGEEKSYQSTWRVNFEGSSRFTAEIDPANVLPERSESNNQASLAVDAQAQNGTNLTVSYRDLHFSPDPALQGLGVTLSATVANIGTDDVSSVKVSFYDGNPANGGAEVGSTYISSIPAKTSKPVDVIWSAIPTAADRIIYVVADPDNSIEELHEDDNVAFKNLAVKSFPDLDIQNANISTAPQYPKQGESFTINATVNNVGNQPASNFIVRAYADGHEIGSGKTVPSLAAQGGTSVQFVTSMDVEGPHKIDVRVDTGNTVIESREDNNEAYKDIVIQNGQFAVTERYLSPNDDGIHEKTLYSFNLEPADQVAVEVVNAQDKVVRSFPMSAAAITGGEQEWDGKSQFGSAVADGEYLIRLKNKDGKIVGSVPVVIDNNRSALAEAFNTPFELINNLNCKVGNISFLQDSYNWYENNYDSYSYGTVRYSDEDSYIFFSTYLKPYYDANGNWVTTSTDIPYPTGVYRANYNGSDVKALAVDAQLDLHTILNYRGYHSHVKNIQSSPNESKVVIQVERYYSDELWLVNADGSGLEKIYQQEFGNPDSEQYPPAIFGLQFAKDSKSIIWAEAPRYAYAHEINIYRYETEKTLVATLSVNGIDTGFGLRLNKSGNRLLVKTAYDQINIINLETGSVRPLQFGVTNAVWSPDGNQIAYPDEGRYRVIDESHGSIFLVDKNGDFIKEIPLPKNGDYPESYYSGMVQKIEWNPDGSEIAYSLFDDQSRIDHSCDSYPEYPAAQTTTYDVGTGGVYLVDLLTSTRKQVAHILPEDGGCGETFAALTAMPFMTTNNSWNGEFLPSFFFHPETSLPVIAWKNGAYESQSVDMFWLQGDHSLLISGGNLNSIYLNLDNPATKTRRVLESYNTEYHQIYPTQTGRMLSFFANSEKNKCVNNGRSYGNWQMQSLLNLTVDLRAITSVSVPGIDLSGTAADKNFSSYELSYAYADRPNEWYPTGAASNEYVINDAMTTWAPPDKGNYLVRLTAHDLAGNSKQVIRQASLGQKPMISNIERTPQYFSPNGDGVLDVMDLSFIVVQPVNLVVTIKDANSNVVRTFEQSYSVLGQRETLRWDGRNNAGFVVPDGEYTIGVLGYTFKVIVDNTAPALEDTSVPFYWLDPLHKAECLARNTSAQYCFIQTDTDVRYSATDANLESSKLESSPGNRETWLEDKEGEKQPLHDVAIEHFRAVAKDKAGNQQILLLDPAKKTPFVVITQASNIFSTIDNLDLVHFDASEKDKKITSHASFEPVRYPYAPKTAPVMAARFDSLKFNITETVPEAFQSIEVLYKPKSSDEDSPVVAGDWVATPIDGFLHQLGNCRVHQVEIGKPAAKVCDYQYSLPTENNRNDDQFIAVFDPKKHQLDEKLIYVAKLRITGLSGEIYESNALSFGGLFYGMQLGIASPFYYPEWPNQYGFNKNLIAFASFPASEVLSVSVSIKSKEDPRYPEFIELDQFDTENDAWRVVSSADHSRYQYLFNADSLVSCTQYEAKATFVMKNGGEYTTSPTVLSSACFDAVVVTKPVVAKDCNTGPTNMVRLTVTPGRPSIARSVYIESNRDQLLLLTAAWSAGANGNVFFNVNKPVLGSGYSVNVDVSSLPEGSNTVYVRLVAVSGDVVEVPVEIKVVKTPPQLDIGYPKSGETYCASHFKDGNLEENVLPKEFEGLSLEGSIRSVGDFGFTVASSDFEQSRCEDPVSLSSPAYFPDTDFIFNPAKFESRPTFLGGEDCAKRNLTSATTLPDNSHYYLSPLRPNPVTGKTEVTPTPAIAVYNTQGEVTASIAAVNWSGAKVCQNITFTIDALMQGFDAHVETGAIFKHPAIGNTNYFSPNGDGRFDTVNLKYSVGESATIDAEVYAVSFVPDALGRNKPVDGDKVAMPLHELTALEGEHEFLWNGYTDAGQTLPDGVYHIYLIATDSCGNKKKQDVYIGIDNTPPKAVIGYPHQGDSISVSVEVQGSVVDEHPTSYVLLANDIPVAQKSLNKSISNGYLGTWNTYGLDGGVLLSLKAYDLTGNESVANETITLPVRTQLLTSFMTQDRFISPNADGRLDTVVAVAGMAVELNASVVVKANNIVIRTLASNVRYASGPTTFVWDGKNDAGQIQPDGTYTIEINATDVVSPALQQSEQVTVVLDNTLPVIDFENRVDDMIQLFGENRLLGNVDDDHFLNYSLSLLATPTGVININLASGDRPQNGLLFELDQHFSQDGYYTIKAQARDQAGNIAESVVRLLIDKTPPAVTVTSPLDLATYRSQQGNVDIHGGIQESNHYTYKVTLTREGEQETTQVVLDKHEPLQGDLLAHISIANLTDGIYDVTVIATDDSGLKGQATIKWIIDNTAPYVELQAPEDLAYITEPVDILGTATDENFQRYELEYVAAQSGNTSTLLTTGADIEDGVLYHWQNLPADGTYQVSLHAFDQAGNSSETQRTWIIDTTAPAKPTLQSAVFDKTTRQVALTWAVNTESDLAGYQVYRSGQLLTNGLVTQTTWTDINVESAYQYTVVAVDRAGLRSAPSDPLTVRADTTPPDVSFLRPASGAVINGLVDLVGTANSVDDFAGYTLYSGLSEDALTAIHESPLSVRSDVLGQWNTYGLQEGSRYLIRLVASDNDGNTASKDLWLTVDNAAPAAPENLEFVINGNAVSLHWDHAGVEQDLAGFLIFRDGKLLNGDATGVANLASFAVPDKTFNDQSGIDGLFHYVVYAIDDAGNISLPSNQIEVLVDTHAPHATITSVQNYQEFDTALFLDAISTDLDLANIKFQFRLKESTTWVDIIQDDAAPYSYQWDTTTLPQGQYELRAVATDIQNHTDANPVVLTVIKRDMQAPALVKNVVAHSNGYDYWLTWDANTETDLDYYRLTGNPMSYVEQAETTYSTSETSQYLNTEPLEAYIVAVDTAGNASDPVSVQAYIFDVKLDVLPIAVLPGTAIKLSGHTASYAEVTIKIEHADTSIDLYTVTADVDGNFEKDVTVLSDGKNNITALAHHPEGDFTSVPANAVIYAVAAPSKPTGLQAVLTDPDQLLVDLSWNANPPEEDVVGYQAYANEELLRPEADIVPSSVVGSDNSYNPEYVLSTSMPDDGWQANAFSQVAPAIVFHWDQPQSISSIDFSWSESLGAPGIYDIYAVFGNQEILLKKFVVDSDNPNAKQTVVLDQPVNTDALKIAFSSPLWGDWVQLNTVAFYGLSSTPPAMTVNSLKDGKYDFTVTAVNKWGMESEHSDPAHLEIGDVVAPESVVLSGGIIDGLANLSWTASASEDVASYVVSRNGEQLVVLDANQLSYQDAAIVEGMSYTYTVKVVDAAGNSSVDSNAVVLQLGNSDVIAPDKPVITAPTVAGTPFRIWDYYVPVSGEAEPDSSVYLIRNGVLAAGPVFTDSNGQFIFEYAYLDQGNNVFTAIAVDAAGNVSIDSDPILVQYVAAELPDLSTTMSIKPNIGIANTSTSINVSIRNTGESAPAAIKATMSIYNSHGGLVLSQSTVVPALNRGQTYPWSVKWTPVSTDDYAVIATADVLEEVWESNESNNVAINSYRVLADLQPALELLVQPSAAGSNNYSANEVVAGRIKISNPSHVFSGTVDVSIYDEQHYLLGNVLNKPVNNLAADTTLLLPWQWNTASTFAGHYQVIAVLKDSDGAILDNKVYAFDIVGAQDMHLAAVTDKPIYKINNDVRLSIDVSNSSSNALFTGGKLSWTVMNAAGQLIRNNEKIVGALMPSETATVSDLWNVKNAAGGNYTVAATLKNSSGTLVASTTTIYAVEAGVLSLSGGINLQDTQVGQGQTLKGSYTLTNTGNTDIQNASVALQTFVALPVLLDDTQQSITLAVGESHTYPFEIQLLDYALGATQISLTSSMTTNGVVNKKLLDQKSFTVVDTSAPEVSIVLPQQNAIINGGKVAALIAANDGNGVRDVWVELDGGQAVATAPGVVDSGKYQYSLAAVSEGAHRLVAYATDTAKNYSTRKSVDFIIDNTPPVITIGGVSNGVYYSANPLISVSANDDHLLQVASTLNGASVQSPINVSQEGSYTLLAKAVDLAGNTSSSSVSFVLDKTAPVITINGVTEGHIYQSAVSPVITVTEANLLQSTITLNGVPHVSGAAITADGNYTLSVTATDTAGHVSQSSVTFSIDSRPLVAYLSGTVSVSHPTINVGDSQSCLEKVDNHASFTISGVRVISQIVAVNTSSVIDTVSTTINLTALESHSSVRPVSTATLAPGKYRCVLQAAVDGNTRQLASTDFDVSNSSVNLNAVASIGAHGRVLVLLDALSAKKDSMDKTSVAKQKAWLQQFLTANGWSFAVVHNAADFEKEFKTGQYVVYALLSNKITLPTSLQQSLVDAVGAGDGMVMGGIFNRRNSKLERALGISFTGKELKASGALLGANALYSGSAQAVFNPVHKLDIDQVASLDVLAVWQGLSGVHGNGEHVCDCDDHGHSHERSSRGGRDDAHDGHGDHDDHDDQNDPCNGPEPALVHFASGTGHSVFAAFDILDEAAALNTSNSVYAQMFNWALNRVHPATLVRAGNHALPVVVQVNNLGNATQARFTLSAWTAGVVVEANGWTRSGNNWIYTSNVPANVEIPLPIVYVASGKTGTASIQLQVEIPGSTPGTWISYQTFNWVLGSLP